MDGPNKHPPKGNRSKKMKNSIKRTLKSRQIGLVQTYHLISGTATTPADSGMDKAFISQVEDLGTGSYRIHTLEPARLDLVVAGLISLTDRAVLSVAAVTKSSVTIAAKNDANTAMDADFAITLVHPMLVDAIY
jgi:hypothetical protein